MALLVLVSILFVVGFWYSPLWKRGSLSSPFKVAARKKLDALPWEMEIEGLPSKPAMCPASYLTYEDYRTSKSLSMTLIAFSNALFTANAADLTLIPSPAARRLLRDHFDPAY
eukprot:CAMPEP_0113708378 /NCGR_PEP_ID=MMETSP0038_2-20120614/28937_1 /TAXON_ID=2898 /ORGANISM="Cryptomonas paramecium" /LENGTH=112 /DNA_ID=CAMNT_0000634055 /DNA_START=205 /DNA_END=540 /DNA_ORIENTATION=+ /assembly_acc=CAM_ASM_000170